MILFHLRGDVFMSELMSPTRRAFLLPTPEYLPWAEAAIRSYNGNPVGLFLAAGAVVGVILDVLERDREGLTEFMRNGSASFYVGPQLLEVPFKPGFRYEGHNNATVMVTLHSHAQFTLVGSAVRMVGGKLAPPTLVDGHIKTVAVLPLYQAAAMDAICAYFQEAENALNAKK